MTTNVDQNACIHINLPRSGVDQRALRDAHDRASLSSGLGGKGNGSCPLSVLRAHPVNPISGIKILAGDSECDFVLPAALPLVWQRLYSSGQRQRGMLGQGWSTPLSIALYISDGQLTILDPFHRDISFALPRVGEALYSLSEKITLERTGERNFELIDEHGVRSLFAMLPRAYDTAVLVGMIDANENKLTIAWNARQWPETVQDSAGRVFVLDYISHRGQMRLGSVGVQRDAVDYEEPTTEVLIRYTYDELGNLFQVIGRTGDVTRQFAYMNHIMIEHVQPSGLVSRYEYDEYEWTGKVTRNWTNNGMSWNFRYLTGETLVYDNLGREEVFRFDKKRRFTSLVDALGGETVRRLDNHGNVLAIVTPDGRTTSYRYDRRSRLMRIESGAKGTGIVYDAKLDKPALLTDALGATTALRYDERGNLLSVTDALGRRTVYQYDPHGSPLTVTDAAGGVATLAYNRAAQPVSYTDCSGNTSCFSYDVDGKLLSVTDAQGKSTVYSYDPAGRLSAVVRPEGSGERYEYDALGRLLALTDAAGKRTSYVLDVDGKPLKRIDDDGAVLEYRYDAARRLVELVDGNGKARRFAYDALDRLSEETGVDGCQTCYRYDLSGLLAAKEELSSGADNGYTRIETTYTRDGSGQVVERFIKRVSCAGSTDQLRSRFTYDELGRMTEAIHGDAIVSLEYDLLGRLVARKTDSGGETTVERHAYDALGKRIPSDLPDGSMGGPLAYACGRPHLAGIDSDLTRGKVALTSQFSYDRTERPLAAVAGQLSTGEGAMPVIPRRDDYDENGNLVAIDDTRRGRVTVHCDPVARILSAMQPQARLDMSFDPAHDLR